MSNMENSSDDVSCLSPQNLGSSSPSKKQSKENTITINCVTFPHPDTMPEQQLLKPTEWSYCDYFWAEPLSPVLRLPLQ
uniref:Growth arrest specific 7 n=4 Tax=Pecora TaxID=35500 RepID=A0AAA9SZD7_BOVIN